MLTLMLQPMLLLMVVKYNGGIDGTSHCSFDDVNSCSDSDTHVALDNNPRYF